MHVSNANSQLSKVYMLVMFFFNLAVLSLAYSLFMSNISSISSFLFSHLLTVNSNYMFISLVPLLIVPHLLSCPDGSRSRLRLIDNYNTLVLTYLQISPGLSTCFIFHKSQHLYPLFSSICTPPSFVHT